MPSDTPSSMTAERSASPQGVIHDIGYRHFDGERRGRRFIRRALFVDSLRGAYGLGCSARSRVMPMLLLAVMCLPALVSKDLRFRVTSLYFSRPLARVDYVLGKFGAMASALFVLTAAPLTIMFLGALVVGLPIGEQMPDYLRASAGAVLLSLILAGIGLVIAAMTPRRGLAVAAVVAVLVVLSGVQAAVQEIAFAEGRLIPPPTSA